MGTIALTAAAILVPSFTVSAATQRAEPVPVPCTVDGTAFACTLPDPGTVTATETTTATTTVTEPAVTVISTQPGPTVTTTAPGQTVTVTAPPPVSTPPTVSPSSSASPSPTVSTPPVIAGWSAPIFSETFDTPAAKLVLDPLKGKTGTYPNWVAYDGFTDTGKRGTYESDIMSVHDGSVDMYLQTVAGKILVSAPKPIYGTGTVWKGTTYGRFSIDFKVDPGLQGFKTAWLLWPDSNNWNEGEVDFPEGDLTGNIGGFSHNTTGTPNQNCMTASTSTKYADSKWHTAVIEWKPTSLRYLLDGVQAGITTSANCIPSKPMHWVLQTETGIGGTPPAPSVAGHLYFDNVEIRNYQP